MRTSVLGLLLVSVSSLWSAPTSEAAAVTFHFEGIVDIAQGELLEELLAPGVTAADLVGTSFHGSYTFDPDAPDTNGSPQLGAYSSVGAPFGMDFHFDHRSFFFESLGMVVVDDLDFLDGTPGLLDDFYAVQSIPSPHPTDPILALRGRLDIGATGTDTVGPSALTSAALPLVPPDLTLFNDGRVFINVIRDEVENGQPVSRVRAGLGGTLRVLRLPEPSTLLLLGAGMLVVGACRRKRT